MARSALSRAARSFFRTAFSSLTSVHTSIGIEIRYTARTRCAVASSNQNEPTLRFHLGHRASIFSSRRVIRLSSGSVMITESPVWYV